jgi:16S rRNA (guanine527-N7)-methyltransferase
MQSARIAELLAPFLDSAVLPATLLQSISTYVDILVRWNGRINLTAIRDPEQIVTRHFGESLFAARHLFAGNVEGLDAPVRLADLGSGAGFPGIPIQLWAPQVKVTLIESNHKKVAFLREIARALTLTDINIQNTRVQALSPALRHSFGVVTLRAVERFEQILPAALTLLAPNARIVLLIGASQLKQAQAALPGLTWSSPILTPGSESRVILIGRNHT